MLIVSQNLACVQPPSLKTPILAEGRGGSVQTDLDSIVKDKPGVNKWGGGGKGRKRRQSE